MAQHSFQKLFKPRPIYVTCNQCGETYDEDKVSFINITKSEDKEVLTFRCPNSDCHGPSKSIRMK